LTDERGDQLQTIYDDRIKHIKVEPRDAAFYFFVLCKAFLVLEILWIQLKLTVLLTHEKCTENFLYT